MVDATKKHHLEVPIQFVPYLEKHRIYELFYELSVELVMKRPEDHLTFLKEAITYSNRSKDRPRVILLAPPFFDKLYFTELLAESTGIEVVCLIDVGSANQQFGDGMYTDSKILADHTMKLLNRESIRRSGWMLVDFPRNLNEALALQKIGVLPTHVLQLVSSSSEDYICSAIQTSHSDMLQACKYYYSQIQGLRNAYKHVLKECKIQGHSMEQLAKHCYQVILIMKHCGAPMLPRVVVIGPRGSGMKTQARLLCQRFNLVNVDMKLELKRSLVSESVLGDHIRMLDACGIQIYHDIVISILKKRLLQNDCLSRGWVLTNFPSTVVDMKALDLIDTPPNRVIILEVPYEICKQRLVLRRVNKYTGSYHHLLTIPSHEKSKQQIETHPDDFYFKVQQQEDEYIKHIDKIVYYCGDTATKVQGSHSVAKVFEIISAAIIRPSPPVPPRCPTASSD